MKIGHIHQLHKVCHTLSVKVHPINSNSSRPSMASAGWEISRHRSLPAWCGWSFKKGQAEIPWSLWGVGTLHHCTSTRQRLWGNCQHLIGIYEGQIRTTFHETGGLVYLFYGKHKENGHRVEPLGMQITSPQNKWLWHRWGYFTLVSYPEGGFPSELGGWWWGTFYSTQVRKLSPKETHKCKSMGL